MKITELVNPENFNVEDYDLHDDLQFFMNNDPEFYRKHYYPAVIKLKICKDRGTDFDSEKFAPLVIEAYKIYKNKFPVKNLSKSLNDEELKEISAKIYETELQNIKSGHYD